MHKGHFGNITLYIIVFCILWTMQPNLCAQKTDTLPNQSKFSLKRALYICHPVANLDARRSHFQGNWIKMNGFRVGLEFFKRYRGGVGLYGSNFIPLPPQDKLQRRFRISYLKTYFEYSILQTYKWEVIVHSGWGIASVEMHHRLGEQDSTFILSGGLVHIFGGGAEYKIWPFLGIGIDLGLRGFRSSTPDEELQQRLNSSLTSPYYALRLKIHFSELGKWIFATKKYKAEKQEYLETKRQKKLKKIQESE